MDLLVLLTYSAIVYGIYAASLPLRRVMIFMPKEPPFFVAAFLQNSAQRIEQGSDAEIILPAAPGRFFKGKVVTVGAYITQGQLQPSGNLHASSTSRCCHAKSSSANEFLVELSL
jgi:multidrug resistance efflux pump